MIDKIVSKYLKQAAKKRPTLGGVQHKNGKEYIIDGYTLHIFNKHYDELSALPQTSEENSLDYTLVYNSSEYTFHEQNEEDRFLFANIKKYVKYVKGLPEWHKGDMIPIVYHEMLFDTNLLTFAIDLHKDDLGTIKIAYTDTRLALKGTDIESLVLPLRILDKDELSQCKLLLENFKNTLNTEIKNKSLQIKEIL